MLFIGGTADQIGVRLPADLLARLDAEASRLSALTATPFTRSMVVRSVLARALPPLDGPSSSTPNPPAAVPQEAAQSPRHSSTPRSTARRAKAAAAPPAPVVADDDEAAAIARHDARGRAHTELARAEALRADLSALIESSKGALIEWSGRRIGPAIGVSGRSVSQFLSGATEGWPKWGDAARAWLDALPSTAPAPDLQRPLFAAGEGTP